MNDNKVLSKNEKFIKDLYIINLYRETVDSFQFSTDCIINDINLERKKLILISVTKIIHPYLKLKYNYSVNEIDEYIINEYPTLLTPNYFNNMIVNFIHTSTYDFSNDKSIERLFTGITSNIYSTLDGGEIKPISKDIFNTIHYYKNIDDDSYTEIINMLIDYPKYLEELSELISTSYVFYKKLSNNFNNNTLNLDRFSVSIYSQINDFIISLSEFDKYFHDSFYNEGFNESYFSETIDFLLCLITDRLKEYDNHNSLPIIF